MSRYSRHRRRKMRERARYNDPMTQRAKFHQSLRKFAIFHIIMLFLTLTTSISFPWFFISFFWGLSLVIRYVKYFRFTDHPTSDEPTQYLPPAGYDDWISRRPEREERALRQEKGWRDRDLV